MINETTKLKKAAEAVKYEIDMFNELSNSRIWSNLNPFQINVLLESFAIHAYCLFRFFYQGEVEIKNRSRIRRRNSDIIAEDFDINRSLFRKSRTPKKDLNIIQKKRDKQLAHLTYNRIYRNSKTKGWNVGNIIIGMQKTMTAFFNSLSDKNKNLFH